LSIILHKQWYFAAGYLGEKVIRYALVLFVVTTLNFLIPRLMPGNPIINILGEEVYYLAPELVQELKAEFGLDRTLFEQYGRYLVNTVKGHWGFSYHYLQPVWEVILFRLRWTLVLLIPSIIFGALLAVFWGVVAGGKKNTRLDTGLTSLSLFLYAMPHYWLAMLAVLVFSCYLGIFPLGGVSSGNLTSWGYVFDVLRHAFLPLAVLTAFKAAYDFLIVRNSVISICGEDYILMARAKGLAAPVVLFKHILKNALAPLVTVTALQFGFMVSGVLLVEMVFSWPGMGTLLYDAVLARDYPLLQAGFFMVAVCVLVANFLADLTYAWLDPRLR
jgi:peptide/nickel transport system permease protein